MKQVDEESKTLFGKFLIQRGFRDIQFTSTFCPYDLEAEYQGKTYYFEIKDRRGLKKVCVDTYGDSIIEENKYNELKLLPKDSVYISNIFEDHKLTLFKLEDEFHTEERWANKTSYFRDRRRVLKTFCCWLNTKEHIYDYE